MNLTLMPKSKELLPLKLTNKAEREGKIKSLKREDYQLRREKPLEAEKQTVKNGLKPSETTLPNLPKRLSKKILPLKSSKDKSNEQSYDCLNNFYSSPNLLTKLKIALCYLFNKLYLSLCNLFNKLYLSLGNLFNKIKISLLYKYIFE